MIVRSLTGKIPGVICAGGLGGVYKSTNGGNNWFYSSNGMNNSDVNSLESSSNGYLFAGERATGKIYRSTDSAASWQLVYNSGPTDIIYKILQPVNSSNIYACIGGRGIYFSTNYGTNWSYFALNLNNIVDFETDSQNFYAISSYSYFYSPNGGISWLQRNVLINGYFSLKDILPDSTGVVFAAVNGTNDGIYKLYHHTDSTLSFSNDIKNTKVLSLYPVESSGIIAGISRGKIYKTTNYGISWELKNSNNTAPILTFCSDSLHNLYAGTANGYFFSSNNGNNWIYNSSIFYNKTIQSIVSPIQGRLIAATDNGIFVSTNSGVNWTMTLSDNIISLARSLTGIIYAARSSFPALYVSSDMGSSWLSITGLPQFYRINSIHVTPNNFLFVGGIMGIYRTSNNGTNWTYCFAAAEIQGFTTNSLNQIYAFSNSYGILYSTNNGAPNSWIQINSGLTSTNIQSMTISSDGYVYAGSNGRGAYKSVNITAIETSNNIPDKFSLSQNYPNPFNPETHFGFRIANFGFVRIMIYDVLGREVATLVNEKLNPGEYEVSWDASDYPSGVYFYKLIVGDNTNNRVFRETKKMMLVK